MLKRSPVEVPKPHSLAARFGGKQGMARQLQTLPVALRVVGREWHSVDFGRVDRFVFLCKGNICRSAYAAARAVSLGVPSASAGLEAAGGDPANEFARRHAVERGLDLEAHRTTRFESLAVRRGDLLICMEPPQARAVQSRAQAEGAQVTLLGLWSRPLRPWLFDPYNQPEVYWLQCLQIIDDGVQQLASAWRAAKSRLRLTPANPGQRSILVPAAFSTAGIAVIRSLGRAGYRVHAAAPSADALGLRSHYATAKVVHPPVGAPDFPAWFRAYVARHEIDMVVSGGGFDLRRNTVFEDYPHLFATNHDLDVLSRGASKAALFAHLTQVSPANCPPFLLVNLDEELPTATTLARLGAPLFLKLDDTESRSSAGDRVIRLAGPEAAQAALDEAAPLYRRALVQGFVPGRGVGAFLLRWNGKILARMMHMRLHEMPHTGGASSYRKSWWHQAIMADAEAKLEAMDWQGVAMVEYRWDQATGRFALMEMNLRFWGSLHVALFAGVDFPALLADAFFGSVPDTCVEGRLGVRVRNTLPYEIGHLVSLFRDREVGTLRKVGAAVEAIALSLDPRVKNDLLFPGDRLLFIHRLADMARGRI